MRILAIGDIIECNKRLREEKLPFVLHMRDACAGQSFWIEEIKEAAEDEKEQMEHVISVFLGEQGIHPVFDHTKLHFIIQ